MEKNYSLKIDNDKNISFEYDSNCIETYGTPLSVDSASSYEIKPGNENEKGTLTKTTIVKEIYRLKTKEIRREDIEYALSLAGLYGSDVRLNLMYPGETSIPGLISFIDIKGMSEKGMYRLKVMLEYDDYYEGEMESRKVLEQAEFICTKEKCHEIYRQFAATVKIREAMSLLKTMRVLLKDSLVLGSSVSICPVKEKTIQREEINHEHI